MKKIELGILVLVVVVLVALPATKALVVENPHFAADFRIASENGTYVGYAVLTGTHPIPVARIEVWSLGSGHPIFFVYQIPFLPMLSLGGIKK